MVQARWSYLTAVLGHQGQRRLLLWRTGGGDRGGGWAGRCAIVNVRSQDGSYYWTVMLCSFYQLRTVRDFTRARHGNSRGGTLAIETLIDDAI